jgi:GTP-binding protein
VYSVEIELKAGCGGDGLASFFREKFIPLGGPDGGDGGRGGDIYIEADSDTTDLSAFRSRRLFKAEKGRSGGKQKKHGRDGSNLVIKVPTGTIVEKVENGGSVFLSDLVRDKQRIKAASGGRGGAGNVHFATATNQAPRQAGSGAPGEEVKIRLELRMPSDICIIGMANSGKSTLLSRLTGASPRIADYPFTTQETILGRAEVDKDILTIAEMPALIEGAQHGRGLGNNFLLHAMRSRLLILLLDATSASEMLELDTLLDELKGYSEDLWRKPHIVALNKIDLLERPDREHEIISRLEARGHMVYPISALQGRGVAEIMQAVKEELIKASGSIREMAGGEYVFRPKPLARREKE